MYKYMIKSIQRSKHITPRKDLALINALYGISVTPDRKEGLREFGLDPEASVVDNLEALTDMRGVEWVESASLGNGAMRGRMFAVLELALREILSKVSTTGEVPVTAKTIMSSMLKLAPRAPISRTHLPVTMAIIRIRAALDLKTKITRYGSERVLEELKGLDFMDANEFRKAKAMITAIT